MSSEENGPPPFERVDELPETPDDAGVLGSEWDRRTFLKAAALGTAAAALWQKGPGLTFGPAAAYANDLSQSPCTANDVVLVGTGLVVNEPCECTGTFNATVAFQLQNNTNTNRYCVALHFPAGSAFGEQDVILHTTPTGSDSTLPPGEHTMYGTITGFPCNTGGTLVCVGPFDANGNPTVVRGKCLPNTCATIAWSTSPNAAGCTTPDQSPPGGQCRHQGICIQGFGISATCADDACVARALENGCCSVPCNGTLRVKIVAGGQTGTPCSTPLVISVKRPGETTFTNVTLSNGCYVDSSPVTGTYTFRATDCHSCFRETTIQVCVQSLTQPHIVVSSPDCSGNVTVTIDQGCPQSGVTFTLQTSSACDGTFTDSSATFTNCVATIQLAQGATTCLRVKASNGTAACDQLSNCVCVAVPAALSIAAPIQSNNPCSGIVTFNHGDVTGGVGPFTFAFSLDGGAFVPGDTFVYNPTLVTGGGLDTSCHSLVVRVTDANGCTATSAATTFSQCVSTSTGCTVPTP